MKIEIETDEFLREPEIIVRCAVVDERIVSIGCRSAHARPQDDG